MSAIDLAPDPAPATRAVINYLARMDEEPYVYYRQPPQGRPYTNMVDEAHEVAITDVRGDLDALSLDRHGIAFLRHGSRFADFDDEDRVRTAYYDEVCALFRGLLGVGRVIAYDFSIRRPDHGPARPDGIPVAGTLRRPIRRAHGDFAIGSGAAKVRALMGDEAEVLLRGRYRAFNFWRPIRGPLTDAPLAVCHPGSMDDGDLRPLRQYQEGRENFISAVHYNPSHRWLHLSKMAADEGVVFSSYDSALPGARGIVAHSAFDDPGRPPDGLPRDSIETRVMAFGG